MIISLKFQIYIFILGQDISVEEINCLWVRVEIKEKVERERESRGEGLQYTPCQNLICWARAVQYTQRHHMSFQGEVQIRSNTWDENYLCTRKPQFHDVLSSGLIFIRISTQSLRASNLSIFTIHDDPVLWSCFLINKLNSSLSPTGPIILTFPHWARRVGADCSQVLCPPQVILIGYCRLRLFTFSDTRSSGSTHIMKSHSPRVPQQYEKSSFIPNKFLLISLYKQPYMRIAICVKSSAQ